MKKFTFKGVLDGFRTSVANQPTRVDQEIVETLRNDHFQVAKIMENVIDWQGQGQGQGHPELYDKGCAAYRNLERINRAWSEIGILMGGMSVKEIKAKWRTIRERYTKEKSKKESEERSGAAGGYKVQWPLYEMMSFLQKHIAPRTTISSFFENKNEDSHQASSSRDLDPTQPLLVTVPHASSFDVFEPPEAVIDYNERSPADATAATATSLSFQTPVFGKRKRERESTESTDLEGALTSLAKSMDAQVSQSKGVSSNSSSSSREDLIEEALVNYTSQKYLYWLKKKRESGIMGEWEEAQRKIMEAMYSVTSD